MNLEKDKFHQRKIECTHEIFAWVRWMAINWLKTINHQEFKINDVEHFRAYYSHSLNDRQIMPNILEDSLDNLLIGFIVVVVGFFYYCSSIWPFPKCHLPPSPPICCQFVYGHSVCVCTFVPLLCISHASVVPKTKQNKKNQQQQLAKSKISRS